jgi:hypothetical protein
LSVAAISQGDLDDQAKDGGYELCAAPRSPCSRQRSARMNSSCGSSIGTRPISSGYRRGRFRPIKSAGLQFGSMIDPSIFITDPTAHFWAEKRTRPAVTRRRRLQNAWIIPGDRWQPRHFLDGVLLSVLSRPHGNKSYGAPVSSSEALEDRCVGERNDLCFPHTKFWDWRNGDRYAYEEISAVDVGGLFSGRMPDLLRCLRSNRARTRAGTLLRGSDQSTIISVP